MKITEEQKGQALNPPLPRRVIGYQPRCFDLGKSKWGVYMAAVEYSDGTIKMGYIQGDIHTWNLTTFQPEKAVTSCSKA